MEYQEENEENWDGKNTSVQDRTNLGMLHGYIDGFSRRLIWLEVPSFNKKLEIIGKFYLDAVKQLQSIPK